MGIHELIYVTCDRCGRRYPYTKTKKVGEERLCRECYREEQRRQEEGERSKR